MYIGVEDKGGGPGVTKAGQTGLRNKSQEK